MHNRHTGVLHPVYARTRVGFTTRYRHPLDTSRPRHWTRALLIGMLLASSAAATENPHRASISRASRDDAISSIPFEQLTPEGRAKVSAVLEKTSVFRRLPTQVIQCDPELFLFIIDHPDIVANIWQLLGIEKVVLTPTGLDTFRANDGAGTTGDVEFLHRRHDLHIIYADGAYDGPMFSKPVTGRCVLVLRTGYQRDGDGQYYITNRLDAFIQLDHVGLDFLAKTFQPLVGRVTDYNFLATGTFIENLSRAAELNPDGMSRLAQRLEHVHPDVRDQFLMLSHQVADKAALRQARMAQYQETGERSRTITTRSQNR